MSQATNDCQIVRKWPQHSNGYDLGQAFDCVLFSISLIISYIYNLGGGQLQVSRNSFLHFWLSGHLFLLGIAPGGLVSLVTPPPEPNYCTLFISVELPVLFSQYLGPIFPCLSGTLNLRQAVFYTSHNAPFPTPPVTKHQSSQCYNLNRTIPHYVYPPLCPHLTKPVLGRWHQQLFSLWLPGGLASGKYHRRPEDGQYLSNFLPASCRAMVWPQLLFISQPQTYVAFQESPFCKYDCSLPILSSVTLLKRSRVSLKQLDWLRSLTSLASNRNSVNGRLPDGIFSWHRIIFWIIALSVCFLACLFVCLFVLR